MLTLLFVTKLSTVLTVIYAGMNLHQLTSSYAYLSEKTEQFRAMLAESGPGRDPEGPSGVAGLIRLNLVFYVVLPAAYLVLLKVSAVQPWALGLLALKFALTAFMDIRAERRIMVGGDYSPRQHAVGRVDNILNLAAAGGVIFLLLRPAGPFP
ncbi:MAG TPA: hypothetical protein VJ385_08820 [Fibrobacteria bacterium]|nr:hypothetical protein [Fibrobacteria bacterium]